jgi:hypothetical protein
MVNCKNASLALIAYRHKPKIRKTAFDQVIKHKVIKFLNQKLPRRNEYGVGYEKPLK